MPMTSSQLSPRCRWIDDLLVARFLPVPFIDAAPRPSRSSSSELAVATAERVALRSRRSACFGHPSWRALMLDEPGRRCAT